MILIPCCLFAYEIANITASAQPKLVDFDDMLIDRPSLFTHVAIVPKTKPCKSMVPEANSSSPPPTVNVLIPTVNVLIPTINPLLKKMAKASPSVPPPSKKAKKVAPSKKKPSKILARDSLDEESAERSGYGSLVSTAGIKHSLSYPRSASRFGGEEMAAQYTPLVDPCVAFAQVMKHINQAINGAFVLARRVGHLALENSSLNYKLEGMKKAISFNNNLNKELDRECRDQKEKLEKLRYDELKCAKADDIINSSKVLAQTKSDVEMALASTAAKAEMDRIQFANSTMRSFLSSPAYEKKMGANVEHIFILSWPVPLRDSPT
ncbi:hypothetical protein LIER_20508 [Lithospermum erythrorhizon]|uniref:Uncharacterized protein n=1 Tax=Lithospermum erythrorhizon TaxID=34254 RepID=A0AAV3QPI7_LITER